MSEVLEFSSVIKEKGIGFLYGLVRGENESEEDYKNRIELVRAGKYKENSFE